MRWQKFRDMLQEIFALALLLVVVSPAAYAQTPVYVTDADPIVDGRGVDVRTGELHVEAAPLSTGDLGMVNGWSGVVDYTKFNAYVTGLTKSGPGATVYLYGKSIEFKLVSGAYLLQMETGRPWSRWRALLRTGLTPVPRGKFIILCAKSMSRHSNRNGTLSART